MTKQKTTKRTLLTSVLSLVLCMAMLIGTTFAWFTDSVTSSNNKIQAGTLKIDLELLDKESGKWNSIKESNEPIFNYDKWEPGYTDVKVLKIENEGTLALKWVAKFISASELSALANVIDVYVCPSENEIAYPAKDDRALSGYKRVGTVAEFINSIEETTTGELKADEEAYLGIALKMQESAGNEYQGMSLGGAFDIQIFATQLASEEDSFDNQYDVNAPDLVFLNGVNYDNFEAALAVAKDGDTITISGDHAPITVSGNITLVLDNATIKATDNKTSAVTLANDFTGKIVVNGITALTGAKGGNGIYVPANTTLDLSGKGRLIAKGNSGVESKDEQIGGSGIGGEGTINIHDLANLNAEGYGINGFGIGGATKDITVTNSTITYAKGGFVQPLAPEDDLWIKKTPEGGAAIGSNVDGAVITLKNATVKNAEGGSKSAGIGARFWTGVTVNIENSTIYVKGGNSSAGIGGSRVVKTATNEDAITVNIVKSTINATGGQYGAGIGSGYDTYCHSFATAPVTTVNIDADSKITAQGGKLAAGIGTGHNVVNFKGEIACDVTNVKAGDSNDVCCLGAECSEAQNVGLGALKLEAFYTYIDVTADNVASTDYSQDNAVYKYSGTFENLNIKTSGTLNQVFDGTKAVVSGTVTLNAPGTAHAYDSLQNVERSGNVTVKNFNSNVLNVLAYNNSSVNITNNTVKAMSVIGGNFKLDISGNTVDGDFGTYTDGENGNNQYGISLRICDYELSMTDNTVTGTYSHAIGINGRGDEAGKAWGTTSSISAFSGNNITVNSTKKDERAALKIWCDVTYAPTQNELVSEAKELTDTIIADTTNVFTLGEGHVRFDIFDYIIR